MQIKISARHIEVSAGTRKHFKGQLSKLLDKFAERPTSANVTVVADGSQQRCEIKVHLSTGLTVQSKSSESIVETAFDTAYNKLSKQLRRYKRQLKNHHKERTQPVSFSGAQSTILASTNNNSEQNQDEKLEPVIIAEMETKIPMLSVGEAVMQMEFDEAPMLVFRNQSHGRVNVVHLRDDGNIGWIDPTLDE